MFSNHVAHPVCPDEVKNVFHLCCRVVRALMYHCSRRRWLSLLLRSKINQKME